MNRTKILKDMWATGLQILATIGKLIADSAPNPPPGLPPEPPVNEPPPPADLPTLNDLMLAMRDFEGQPGDQNYRLNNPLNCRYSPVGYAAIYGTVLNVKGFAKFKTPELGWRYARTLLLQKIDKHPFWTIRDLIGDPIEGWAPASDNNPVANYSAFIAGRLKVDPAYRLINLIS